MRSNGFVVSRPAISSFNVKEFHDFAEKKSLQSKILSSRWRYWKKDLDSLKKRPLLAESTLWKVGEIQF